MRRPSRYQGCILTKLRALNCELTPQKNRLLLLAPSSGTVSPLCSCAGPGPGQEQGLGQGAEARPVLCTWHFQRTPVPGRRELVGSPPSS